MSAECRHGDLVAALQAVLSHELVEKYRYTRRRHISCVVESRRELLKRCLKSLGNRFNNSYICLVEYEVIHIVNGHSSLVKSLLEALRTLSHRKLVHLLSIHIQIVMIDLIFYKYIVGLSALAVEHHTLLAD